MLKRMRLSDIEWVRRNRNNPENMKWFRQDHRISFLEQLWWFFTNTMDSSVIWDGEERVGVVALSHIDRIAKKCEFSIMISDKHKKMGHGKKAMKELLDYAFNGLGMNQVYSDVFEGNPAIKMYKKMGFKVYGIFPHWYLKSGEYVTSVLISITREEYDCVK